MKRAAPGLVTMCAALEPVFAPTGESSLKYLRRIIKNKSYDLKIIPSDGMA
jgi:hypothetical protein